MNRKWALEELYSWVTQNGRLSPPEALESLRQRERIKRGLNTAYSPYGDSWAQHPDMPVFDEAVRMVFEDIDQRLREEAAG